jgi:hypothetical protein
VKFLEEIRVWSRDVTVDSQGSLLCPFKFQAGFMTRSLHLCRTKDHIPPNTLKKGDRKKWD